MTDNNIFAKELKENEEILWQGSKKNKIFSGLTGLWPRNARILTLGVILYSALLLFIVLPVILIFQLLTFSNFFNILLISILLLLTVPVLSIIIIKCIIFSRSKEEYALTNERIIIKRNNNIISAELSDIRPSFIEIFTEKNNTGSVTFLVDYYIKNSIKKKRSFSEALGFYGIDNPSEVTKQLKYLI